MDMNITKVINSAIANSCIKAITITTVITTAKARIIDSSYVSIRVIVITKASSKVIAATSDITTVSVMSYVRAITMDTDNTVAIINAIS